MPISPITFLDKRPTAVVDTECYPNYWSIGFKNTGSKKTVIFEQYAGKELNRAAIAKIFRKFRLITFNGNKYDNQMIALAMKGASNKQLKAANDDLIRFKMLPWTFSDKYGCELPEYADMIDLFDVAPGVRTSLKKYGARLGAKWLQELPFHFDRDITPDMRPMMRRYLSNDLDTTELLADHLATEMEMRAEMSVEYGIDLRSKSDSQIAEALIKWEVEKRTGKKLPKPEDMRGQSFKYNPPSFVKFETEYMRGIFKIVRDAEFVISDKGMVKLPPSLSKTKLSVKIGMTEYTMGIGGLHSKEHKRTFLADEDTKIVDSDVRGYYPGLMLAGGFYPKAVGEIFIPVFKGFVRRRDEAKEAAKRFKKIDKAQHIRYKKISDSLKIVNNGTFGKSGSPFSVLYGPKMLIQTTITGQLAIMMLIERLEAKGFGVISANTDGIVTLVRRSREWLYQAIIFDWECETSLTMEFSEYSGVYSRDVNNYVAIPHDLKTNPDAKVKTKGVFSPASLQEKHDPTFDICSTAVINYLVDGDDIEETIRACDDMRKFVGIKQVKDGGEKDGEYIGMLVRWYYPVGETGFITDVKSGNRVAGTRGARPCMDLPDEFPDDIDYAWYIREAYARLDDVGLPVANPADFGKCGYTLATLPKLKTVHIVDLSTGRSLCDKRPKAVREPWEEQNETYLISRAGKLCKACEEARQAERGFEFAEADDALE